MSELLEPNPMIASTMHIAERHAGRIAVPQFEPEWVTTGEVGEASLQDLVAEPEIEQGSAEVLKVPMSSDEQPEVLQMRELKRLEERVRALELGRVATGGLGVEHSEELTELRRRADDLRARIHHEMWAVNAKIVETVIGLLNQMPSSEFILTTVSNLKTPESVWDKDGRKGGLPIRDLYRARVIFRDRVNGRRRADDYIANTLRYVGYALGAAAYHLDEPIVSTERNEHSDKNYIPRTDKYLVRIDGRIVWFELQAHTASEEVVNAKTRKQYVANQNRQHSERV